MAKKGQIFKKYPLDLKLKIVKEKIDVGKSYKFLSDHYKISEGTITTWVYMYRRDGGLDIKQKGRPVELDIDYKERYEILKKFQDFLGVVEQKKK
ncbi:hypothetical protein [Mariniplasma anaerobium]|uniref:Transposase n=1 Tax=Mariniplasma anaerobium TaxID=2735436 RepID=A0A7U9XV48_9MOLU|nr:hypothetical protein [Mariniplasma anaerobium]BCR35782.1 hypothetical protein MPAN_006750 [Mariniplasma anaerobium]